MLKVRKGGVTEGSLFVTVLFPLLDCSLDLAPELPRAWLTPLMSPNA